jgi:hypothetical protein
MKAAKWIVLAGGVLALIGLFLPFVTVRGQSLSAFELLLADDDIELVGLREIAPEQWLPAIALVVLATVAVARRMGIVNATLSLLAAILCVSEWFSLREAMVQISRVLFGPDDAIVLGLGTHALLVGGVLGVVGAGAAIFRPEPA